MVSVDASPKASGSFNSPSNGTNDSALSSDEVYIDTIKRREEKLSNCEDIAKKFTEVIDVINWDAPIPELNDDRLGGYEYSVIISWL